MRDSFLFRFLSSLRLTVACLAVLMVLVVACTLAQARMGTYDAVELYMRGFWVWWRPFAGWKVPIFPGGGLVGLVLLANLIAAQAARLEVSRRKAGIWIVHFGLILLFVGEFASGMFQVETQLALREGETSDFGQDPRTGEKRRLPFSLTLKDFTHEVYPGTEIPRNFSSLLRLKDSVRGTDRDVLISMNNPLRYGGRAVYQSGFGEGDTMSILQIVENPGWLLPYLSCILVGLGLAGHFLGRLRGAA